MMAFLALEPAPKSRSRLCDLFWTRPSDPRAELRWCLSRLRSVLDDGARQRVRREASLISLDLSDCQVDAVELSRLSGVPMAEVAHGRLLAVAEMAAGDLLEGVEADGVELAVWLAAARQRLRFLHVGLLAELSRRAPEGSEEMFRWLDAWLARAPFDESAHAALIRALVRAGRQHDAELHVDVTSRTFEQEGLDWAAMRSAWQAARQAASAGAEVASDPPLLRPAEVVRHHPGSVVVMPFVAASPNLGNLAGGLTEDLITGLAKLRVLFVIARGTSYALAARGIDARDAGRVLNVSYVVTGTTRELGGRISVHVELAETDRAGILWADEQQVPPGEAMAALDALVDRMVAGVAEQIEQTECKRVLAKPPSSLDAWDSYHRGLWHMYLFTAAGNEVASECFRTALAMDPGFARAHAGLSFTHFQNVFLRLKPDPEREAGLALEAAGRSLTADNRDPAAHWAMGRALWLRGDPVQSVHELERSIELSPNFALGHYTLGFVLAQSGDPKAAMGAADTSRALSPFDPLQFAMLACRALAHLRLGEHEAAAAWAVKATTRPNAHVHILAIAATSLALARRHEQATAFVARIHERLPGYDVEVFLRAFRFTLEMEQLIRHTARQIGFC